MRFAFPCNGIVKQRTKLSTVRIAALAALVLFCGTSVRASNLTFGIGSDPHQNYTFTPVGSSQSVTLDVGPYSAYIEENGVKTWGEYFCISYTKTANWNTVYSGQVIDPSTQQQVEAAYLDSQLATMGGVNATLAAKGAISMAIWQIMGPGGAIPIDPAAQTYVQQAQNLFSQGAITAAMFTSTDIFVPNQCNVQSFMLMTTGAPTPEPGPIVLVLTGAVLLGIVRHKRR